MTLNFAKGRVVLTSLATVSILAGCADGLDFDVRGALGGAFDTSNAARQAQVAARPKPDSRGVIAYSDYKVAVARRGDTVQQVADRVGVSGATLAKLNGLAPNGSLRDGEILTLPRGAAPSSSTTTATALTPTVVDVTELSPGAVSAGQNGAGPAVPEPVRHTVEPGETAFTIARLYNVPVKSLRDWNGLGANLDLREGQTLLIPVVVETTETAAISAPGTGTTTPTPPSSMRPQPRAGVAVASAAAATRVASAPAPSVVDLKPATAASAPASAAVMTRPVQGSIIRGYKKGRNEGIDIGAPAGTSVKAAKSGRVAAISKDTNGVNLLVVQHADNLLTVYTNIDGISVNKGDSIKRGQGIAKVASGSPSFLHFEVRRGLESLDPEEFL